jgi:hypothetical protein
LAQDFWVSFLVSDPAAQSLGGNCRLGDTKSITPKLWSYIIDRFGIRSMLDVGCGEGHALLFFHRKGVIAHGIDGLEQNLRRAVHPAALHDLRKSAYVYPCDLVLCVEVVEHIEEKHIENLMLTLQNAPVIVMTHALPEQPGHHHVNCKPTDYWISRLQERSYHLSPENDWLRQLAHAEVPDCYFSKSGLVFLRP